MNRLFHRVRLCAAFCAALFFSAAVVAQIGGPILGGGNTKVGGPFPGAAVNAIPFANPANIWATDPSNFSYVTSTGIFAAPTITATTKFALLAGSNGAPALGFSGGIGLYQISSSWVLGPVGAAVLMISNPNLTVAANGQIGWSSSTGDATAAVDTILARDAADNIACRRGTNPCVFKPYETYTDGSNYSRVGIGWGAEGLASSTFGILTAAAGTGSTARPMVIGTAGTGSVSLRQNAVDRVVLTSNGLQITTGASANQLRTAQTTPPTCTTNCGTPGNACVGTDTAMICTMGTTPASGVLITFNGTWAAAPACVVQMALAGMVVGKQVLTAATTTTTITLVTNGTAPSTSDKYAILCMGVQ